MAAGAIEALAFQPSDHAAFQSVQPLRGGGLDLLQIRPENKPQRHPVSRGLVGLRLRGVEKVDGLGETRIWLA